MPRWITNVSNLFRGDNLQIMIFLLALLGVIWGVYTYLNPPSGQEPTGAIIMPPDDPKAENHPGNTRSPAPRLQMLLREPLTEFAHKHAMKQGETIFVQRILDPRRWGSELGENIRGVLQNVLSAPGIGLRLQMMEPYRADYALQGILMELSPSKRELQLEFLRRTDLTWDTLETISIPLSGVQQAGNPDRTYRMVCATGRHRIQCRGDGPINEENCQIWEALRFARVLAEAEISQQGSGTTSNRHEQQFDLRRDRMDRDIIEKEGRGTLTGIEDGDLPRIIGRSVEVQRCAQVMGSPSSP
uniref:Uncharacterized protein n=1 Tax=Candidatus Kentrum sp. DK TaxID=2126562 RepID=A0A450RU76_9GAMM|nr:MAG: hypothetical protein BECKDK2373C_GA0170839_1001114 [Candidatus Kentron sp. DK]